MAGQSGEFRSGGEIIDPFSACLEKARAAIEEYGYQSRWLENEAVISDGTWAELQSLIGENNPLHRNVEPRHSLNLYGPNNDHLLQVSLDGEGQEASLFYEDAHEFQTSSSAYAPEWMRLLIAAYTSYSSNQVRIMGATSDAMIKLSDCLDKKNPDQYTRIHQYSSIGPIVCSNDNKSILYIARNYDETNRIAVWDKIWHYDLEDATLRTVHYTPECEPEINVCILDESTITNLRLAALPYPEGTTAINLPDFETGNSLVVNPGYVDAYMHAINEAIHYAKIVLRKSRHQISLN